MKAYFCSRKRDMDNLSISQFFLRARPLKLSLRIEEENIDCSSQIIEVFSVLTE